MPRLMLTVKGTPSDHVLVSDNLPEQEAASQLADVGVRIGTPGRITLPWVAVMGSNVLAAQLIEDEEELAA